MEDLQRLLQHWFGHNWATLIASLGLILAVISSAHIILHKRDSRAAATWVGLVWLVPVIGVLIYLLLGVNRIRRRARFLTGGGLDAVKGWRGAAEPRHDFPHWQGMSALITELTGWPLTGGNDVEPLAPKETFDAQIAAIDDAVETVFLSSYIFGNDAAGKPLVAALVRAHRRGVQVRVLIDGFGSWYSLPSVRWRLGRAGIKVQRFLYSWAPWRMPYLNLRNHRKLLIVDRKLGFMGGMNIRAGYIAQHPTINDIHFRIKGPMVGHLLHSFAADWQFTCGEALASHYAGRPREGNILCRGISAGPDGDFDKRRLVLLAAIARADASIRIVTPYFVPDQALQTALQLAALRGVTVDIVLPRHNNLPLVHWASLHGLYWLAKEGCRIHLSAPPFDHSKLMTVDGIWALVGSGNWDARSLRLNFEFDMECYSEGLVERINRQIDLRLNGASRLDHNQLAAQSLPIRLRNALASLLGPYL